MASSHVTSSDTQPRRAQSADEFAPWDPEAWIHVREVGKGAAGTVAIYERRDLAESKKRVLGVRAPPKPQFVVKRIAKTVPGAADLVNTEWSMMKAVVDVCPRFFPCLFGGYKDEAAYYLVSNYLAGAMDLYDYVGATKSLKDMGREERSEAIPTQIKPIIVNLVAAVDALHRKGIAHRDLKLENVLVNPTSYEVWLIDLALSCGEALPPPCTYRRLGTLGQLPPEVLTRDPARAYNAVDWMLADQWSLGITILLLIMHAPLWRLAQEEYKGDALRKQALVYNLMLKEFEVAAVDSRLDWRQFVDRQVLRALYVWAPELVQLLDVLLSVEPTKRTIPPYLWAYLKSDIRKVREGEAYVSGNSGNSGSSSRPSGPSPSPVQ